MVSDSPTYLQHYNTQKSVQIWKDLIFFTFNFCSVKWQSEWMCMLEIRLIMDEKTNSNDKEKKLFFLLFFTNYLTFYNRNYSANSAPLSNVFRLLLSHGLTIVTWFCMMAVVLSQRSDVINPARSLLKYWINHVIDHRHVIFVLTVV